MNIQQLSVFVENKAGRVSEVSEVLGAADINIRGFSVSDSADYGIMRLIVDDPIRATEVLHAGGFAVKASDVVCVELPDEPGGLADVLKAVAAAGVNVEYVYSLIGTYVVLNVADTERAAVLLGGTSVRMVSQEEIARA
jgi:hypothetical protein